MNKFKAILKDDSGQGMLEYVLILAIVVAIGMAFKNTIVQWFTGKTQDVTSKADQVFQ